MQRKLIAVVLCTLGLCGAAAAEPSLDMSPNGSATLNAPEATSYQADRAAATGGPTMGDESAPFTHP